MGHPGLVPAGSGSCEYEPFPGLRQTGGRQADREPGAGGDRPAHFY